MQLFLKNGIRHAEAGEFTLRAFLNGKMDLSQAEAVADLISSGKKKGVNHKHILKMVSEFYDIKIEDLIIKGRKKEVVRPRQIAMYLLRTELNYSYPGIGEKLGGRDHTTAIHAFEKISKELQINKQLLEDVTYLKENLYNIS